MKTISKLIAYVICLQLTVGTYPIQNQLAYAWDDRTDSEPNRGPASENLSMSPEEVNDNAKNYIEQFQGQCIEANGGIKENVAFIHDQEIGGEEPRMYNCAAAAEVIQKVIAPGMNDIQEEVENSQVDPNCPTCGIPNQSVGGNSIPEGAECSLAEQQKYAKTADKCDAWCGLSSVLTLGLATSSSCDSSYKSAGVAASCLVDLAKGVVKGIWEVLTFIPKLIWDGVKWGWNKLFGKTESTTSEKAHALAGLSDEQIKQGKKDPKALEQSFLQKAGMFFKEFGKAVIGYPEYEEKAKCTDCGGKAALMCGVIGNTGGFLLTLFGNGLIFGATKGLGTKIASKIVKFSKGTTKFSKFTASTLKVTSKTGKFIAKPFIGFGNVIVKGASKLSKGTIKWWTKFKGSKTYAALGKFKNTGVYKKVFSANSIPGKITLKFGRGVKNAFNKMGAFEDRMFMKGVKLTNKQLHTKMLRAQTINALRIGKHSAELGEVGKVDILSTTNKDTLVYKTDKGTKTINIKNILGKDKKKWKDFDPTKVVGATSYDNGRFVFFSNKDGTTTIYDTVFKEPLKTLKISSPEEAINVVDDLAKNIVKDADGSSAATNEALRGVDELKVVRDVNDARTPEEWLQVKKDASNKLQNLKVKNLDDIENIKKSIFLSIRVNKKVYL
jgi:hypothetical protein